MREPVVQASHMPMALWLLNICARLFRVIIHIGGIGTTTLSKFLSIFWDSHRILPKNHTSTKMNLIQQGGTITSITSCV